MILFPDKNSIHLNNGQCLSYAIYGDAYGAPVYYMHGLYGSRIEAMLAADAADRCNTQLIAVDRPGVGTSSPEPGLTLKSWAATICELADHLGHEKFSILGVSGGGPFALRCAYFLPERIEKIALCGSLAPLIDQTLTHLLPFRYKVALWLQKHFEPGLKWANKRLYTSARHDPSGLLRKLARHLPDCDKKILVENKTRDIMSASLNEATCQGPLYGEQELTILGSRWGFDLNDIPISVDIWHGGQDEVVPMVMAHYLAEKLQHSSLHIIPDEGHFSLPILHAEEILHRLMPGRKNVS